MCCGNKRNTLSASARIGRSGPRSAGLPSGAGLIVYFEYTGSSSLLLTGRVTGRRYHFPEKGAIQQIDIRDARTLAGMPALRQVAGPEH